MTRPVDPRLPAAMVDEHEASLSAAMLQECRDQIPRRLLVQDSVRQSLAGLRLALAVGLAYFLAARLSLALLTLHDGVAVFWPAAGIASGLIIALGPSAQLPVVMGAAGAGFAASLLGKGNLEGAIMFALVSAGEALLIAWLIKRQIAANFSLDGLHGVLALLMATLVGTALAAGAGTAGEHFLHSAGAPTLSMWKNWFAADALGVVSATPLIIGIVRCLSDPPETPELIEGLLALAAIVLVSGICFAAPRENWFTILPLGSLLPLLLWPAARCRPVFAAAAALLFSLAVVSTITLGIGRLGDPSIPLVDRVTAARAALLFASMTALIFAAVFAERRCNELAFRNTNDRLQLALDGAELGIWSVDLTSGRHENDARDRRNHGHHPTVPPTTLAAARSFIHPDDLPRLDAAFAASARAGGSYKAEYRLAALAGGHSAQQRWVAVEGTVLRNSNGRAVRLLGVTRDITARKQTEEQLAERSAQLELAGRAAMVGSYAYDVETERMQVSEGYVAIHGFPEGTTEIARREWQAKLEPEVKLRLYELRSKAFRERRNEYNTDYRIVRSGGEAQWIESRSYILYSGDGKPLRVVGVNIDVTERKRAELALSERNAQLELAGKVARVGSFTFEHTTQTLQLSPGCATIYGLPEDTMEIARDSWRALMHPADWPRLDADFRQAIATRQRELILEFRVIRTNGEVRWIEARNLISYDDAGRPSRSIGVNIDVTERKHAENHKNLLIAELDHRVKNALACVAVMMQHARESSNSMDEFLEVLDGRIHSLASTHILLSRSRWQGVSLAELVRGELAPCIKDGNTLIEGPDIDLVAEATQPLAMVLHELVTNAAKYGALSNGRGRVSVHWDWLWNGSSRDRLAFQWRETEGPPVVPAGQAGFGTSVIRDLIPYELGGSVDYVLAPEGVRCTLEIPSKWLSMRARSSDAHNGAGHPSHASA